MTEATLTRAQAELLKKVERRGCVAVRGSSYRVACALSAKGLIELRIGGTGVAWQGPWWYEAVAANRQIPLAGEKGAGRVARVDVGDYEMVAQHRWYLWEKERTGRNAGPYAVAVIDGKRVRMHNLLVGLGCDHRNGDGLDNRRSNLRLATPTQQAANSPSRGGSSAFKGVSWDRLTGKWRAQITTNGRRRFLGAAFDEEEAARVYDAAAREAWGDFAFLNFPEAVHA